MTKSKYTDIYNKVKAAMEQEKLFLQSDITMMQLSRIVGTNRVYLSKAINEGYGCGYSEMLNRYRLDFLFRKAIYDKKNIEKLVTEYGFWSRTTFYDIFKIKFGTSPRRFMDEHDSKDIQRNILPALAFPN